MQDGETAIIGGLISSTLLTLVLIPVIYTYVDGLKTRLPALFKRAVWAARIPWKGRPAGVPVVTSDVDV